MNRIVYIKKYHPIKRRILECVIYTDTIKLLLNGKYSCKAFWGGEQITNLDLLDELCREIKNRNNA